MTRRFLLLRAAVTGVATGFLCHGQNRRESEPSSWKAPLLAARDRQDTEHLDSAASGRQRGTSAPDSFSATYVQALASSYLAEVYLEQGKKPDAAAAAERGIRLAREALRLQPKDAEHHRLLGTLCGQVIPANLLSAVSYGQCAREEIETALRLDPHLAEAYLGRGVGNYYLPPAFGGGVEKAIADFRKAAELAPQSGDVQLWLGLALRKQGNPAAARQHLERAQSLSPSRAWIRQQLEKTPVPSPGGQNPQ